jgi:alpha-amylase/alpha-mannosidase (GH57 family)
MPHIYLCFVWHMHQPFYKDLLTGEYRLPWTRMHALKDYYGMVQILEEFPEVHQTFNLVPSLLAQIDEYATGSADDPFLRMALKPAEELTDEEQAYILRYFFQANPGRLIYRYPRYGELYDMWQSSGRDSKRARRLFGADQLRDLQVLSQLAWFDEEFQEKDPDVRRLVEKERGYSLEDQSLLGRKQPEKMALVVPAYREFARRGQIELTTTPYYHPILPLLCDSNIAETAHPYVPLPSRFCYPRDARLQLERAQEFMKKEFGTLPAGLWPSEGSVSDEVLALAAEIGFRWSATDNGVLARTLGHQAGAFETYRPYLWEQQGARLAMIFRDHRLSDLIGFVYSRMGAAEAANHFLHEIRENCRGILGNGEDALVPIILDGENAWEYYEKNGRPFLRELYRRILADGNMSAVTVSEALARIEPRRMDHIFPGSWINANFDVWIGAEEDNTAWDYLLRARRTYDQVLEGVVGIVLTEAQKRLATEELLIAEGSDWCWWYGPEHDSANRPEFDQLFRLHLANVYRALGLHPPDELSRPILGVIAKESHDLPAGAINATIDGEITSYFEWLGAGLFHVDNRSGAMHGQRFVIRELRYGSNGSSLFLRLDFEEKAMATLSGAVVKLNVAPASDAARVTSADLYIAAGVHEAMASVEYAFSRVLEVKVPLAAIGAGLQQRVRFQLSLWQNGLPLDALPQQGWLEVGTSEPGEWF